MIRSRDANSRGDRAMLFCFTTSLLVSIAAVLAFHHGDAHASLYLLANLVGQTAQSLRLHNGLTVVTDTMGTPGQLITFHAARMPVPSTVVALGWLCFGEYSLRSTALLKAVLLLCPLWLAMRLVFRVARWSTQPMYTFAALLLVPFLCMLFLADVVNLQVEEGYSYSLLALSFALILFAPPLSRLSPVMARGFGFALALGISLDLLFLSKSSMSPVLVVLVVCFLLRNQKPALQALLLLTVALALGGWAMRQHAASGRYSLGTSLDGLNLHKGNNAHVAQRYPPRPGQSLDGFDEELNDGRHFADEWAFRDFHMHAATDYIRQHKQETLRNDLVKARVFFVSLTRYGSSRSYGTTLLAETFGLLIFRVLLGSAVVVAVLGAMTGGGPGRFAGCAFLAVTAACALPYVIGFAYTRHASVLLYPSVLLLCRAMLSEKDIAA